VAKRIEDIEELFLWTQLQFKEIEGVGDKASISLQEFFSSTDHQKEIQDLLAAGVEPKKMTKIVGHAFFGKSFVLTGSLENYTRTQASQLIQERGGIVSSSVSRKTDYLLVGENPGSKYDRAKRFEVAIVDETAFQKML